MKTFVWSQNLFSNVLLRGRGTGRPARLVSAHPREDPRSHHMVSVEMIAVCLPSKILLALKLQQAPNCPCHSRTDRIGQNNTILTLSGAAALPPNPCPLKTSEYDLVWNTF